MRDYYAQLPDGRLIIADGIHKMKVWDGLKAAPVDAGMPDPGNVSLALSGENSSGNITGEYRAFIRYVDDLEQVSDPTTLADLTLISSGSPVTVSAMTAASPIVVTATSHGFTTGSKVTIADSKAVEYNGVYDIYVVDANTFNLVGTDGRDFETFYGSATATAGSSKVNYTFTLTPPPKAEKFQILRNTAGQLTTFYVDYESSNLSLTSANSTLEDDTLATQEAVPLTNPDGSLSAYAHGQPPSSKAVVAHHLDRLFAAVDRPYTQGAVSVTNGSTTVRGIGTNWVSTLAGRLLFVDGANTSFSISSIDESNQTLTIGSAYSGTTAPFRPYSIRTSDADRRLVYFSEAGFPEYMPASNTIQIQEDGDTITGLMVKGSFVYILEESHIYRHTFQTSPDVDGFTFLTADRGCINELCWVKVEETAFMLDRGGIHAFTGGQESQQLSNAIQNLFKFADSDLHVNWQAKEYFFACSFPDEEIVRWFVALNGTKFPRHAITYHHRLKRWWIEEFSIPITMATLGLLNDRQQVFLGGQGSLIWAGSRGFLDGLRSGAVTVRGSITSATVLSLTCEDVSWTDDIVGLSVHIIVGRGKGQWRTIASVSGDTLTVSYPWLIVPDETSVFQIAGFQYKLLMSTFLFAESEQENPRTIGVYYNPLQADHSILNIRAYLDENDDAVIWDNTHSADEKEGIGSIRDSDELVLDMQLPLGYAQQRIDNRKEINFPGPRQITFELNGVSGDEQIGVGLIQIDGVNEAGGSE